MLDNATVTDVSQIDWRVALRRRIVSRINSIQTHADVARKHGVIFNPDRVDAQIDCFEEWIERLDYYSHIEPQLDVLRQIRRDMEALGTEESQCRSLFGGWYIGRYRKRTEPFVEAYLDLLTEHGKKARALERQFLLDIELREKQNLGWFLVFNTLTVSDEHYHRIFAKGSRYFANYIRAVDRGLWKARFPSVRSGMDACAKGHMHTYCAVVERGENTGRLHIHVLHCLRWLPLGARDPNMGQPVPRLRELDCFRRYWTHSHSTPIAVRLHGDDAYARLGWIWPVVKKNRVFQPVEAKPVSAIAAYMSKYVTKSIGDEGLKGKWRTKTSRNYGLSSIRLSVQAMKSETLRRYVSGVKNTANLPTLGRLQIPARLLRVEATRELIMRMTARSIPKTWKSMVAVTAREPIVQRLRTNTITPSLTTTKTKTTLKRRSTGTIPTTSLREGDISDAYACLDAVFTELTWSDTHSAFSSRSFGR